MNKCTHKCRSETRKPEKQAHHIPSEKEQYSPTPHPSPTPPPPKKKEKEKEIKKKRRGHTLLAVNIRPVDACATPEVS